MRFSVRCRRGSTRRSVASPRARSRCAAGTGSFFATVFFAAVFFPVDVLPLNFPALVRFVVAAPPAGAVLGAVFFAGRGLPVTERAVNSVAAACRCLAARALRAICRLRHVA